MSQDNLIECTDSDQCLSLGKQSFLKGDFVTARECFVKGHGFEPTSNLKTWIRKCTVEIGDEFEIMNSTNVVQKKDKEIKEIKLKKDDVSIRNDFFQTPSHVILSIFIKSVKNDDVKIVFKEQELEVCIKMDNGREYALDLELFDKILPEKCVWNIFSTKIEVKMTKVVGTMWASLEKCTSLPIVKPSYPSSHKRPTDWDSIEEPQIKKEGLAVMMDFLKDISCKGDDDKRRAMEKSYYESGGTVLSTNWEDVGSRTVEGTAPQGMEMRKWSDLHH